MRYSTQIKPISYLKANAAEVLQELTAQRQPLVITQNGEAKDAERDLDHVSGPVGQSARRFCARFRQRR